MAATWPLGTDIASGEPASAQADNTKDRGGQAAGVMRQAIVRADGGGNNMLMVRACGTAVKPS